MPAEAWVALLVASNVARVAACAGICLATARWAMGRQVWVGCGGVGVQDIERGWKVQACPRRSLLQPVACDSSVAALQVL